MLSIVTPTGDRPQCLRLLIQYIARQTYNRPVEWIIVDDGVSGRVRDLVPEDYAAVTQRGWRVQYIKRIHERGLSAVQSDGCARFHTASFILIGDTFLSLMGSSIAIFLTRITSELKFP